MMLYFVGIQKIRYPDHYVDLSQIVASNTMNHVFIPPISTRNLRNIGDNLFLCYSGFSCDIYFFITTDISIVLSRGKKI